MLYAAASCSTGPMPKLPEGAFTRLDRQTDRAATLSQAFTPNHSILPGARDRFVCTYLPAGFGQTNPFRGPGKAAPGRLFLAGTSRCFGRKDQISSGTASRDPRPSDRRAGGCSPLGEARLGRKRLQRLRGSEYAKLPTLARRFGSSPRLAESGCVCLY